MNTKLLLLLLTGSLLALAAWFVHGPSEAPSVAAGLDDERGATHDVPEKYRDTVQRGLEYLAKHQHDDGHWEGDGGQHPVAMTGLTGLALLMERNGQGDRRGGMVVRAGKNTESIVKAVDWLLEQQQAGRDGLIFSGQASETARYMEGHGLATLFLAGACRDETDDKRRKKLTDVLTRAVHYIVKAQSSQGGWYHTSRMEGHDFDALLPTVIQIQALQAAELAGIPMPSALISDAQATLKQRLGSIKEGPKAGQVSGRPVETAAALACFRPNPAWAPPGESRADQKEEFRKSFKVCQTALPVGRAAKLGRDEVAHYYYAQAAFNLDESWSSYRTAMFDHLQSCQHQDGSWPPADGLGVGPVYATAVWCTVLQLGNKSHPSTRAIDHVIE